MSPVCYRGASCGVDLLEAELRDAERCAAKGCQPCRREADSIRAALNAYALRRSRDVAETAATKGATDAEV